MKKLLLVCAALLCSASFALAEGLPSESDTVFTPETETGTSALGADYTKLTVSNAAATPVAVDPIDKPTATPAPTPNYVYTSYANTQMGVSFSIPYTWLLNPATNQDTTAQFVEPKSEMMDVGGYQTRLTVEKVNRGLAQTAADARSYLESTLETMADSFTTFTAGNIASATVGKANGAYCYYKAEYNDGSQTYVMNGRITIVAHDNSLYEIRITAPRAWYAYYEHVFRKVRQTFSFL